MEENNDLEGAFQDVNLDEENEKIHILGPLFWILFICLWISFLSAGIIEIYILMIKIFNHEDEDLIFWNYYFYDYEFIFFIKRHKFFLLLPFIIALAFGIIQFCFCLINAIKGYIKGYDYILGKNSKCNMIPLFLCTILFIIGIYTNFYFYSIEFRVLIYLFFITFLLHLIAIISLIILFCRNRIKKEQIEHFFKDVIIKRGTYSCLLALLIYSSFYYICFIKPLDFLSRFYNLLPISLCIIIMIVALIYRELILIFINIVIYLFYPLK